jgi:alpha-ketoglutarate-dependent taurine dioxygenase
MTFAERSLTPLIGAEVKSDIETLLGGSRAKQIRTLLEARGVVVFPQIHMSDAQQIAFARTLGDVVDQGEKGIFKVTLDPKENAVAEYLKGTVLWHFDGFSEEVPILASLLSCRRTSPVGGQTSFANTYAGWDHLPEARKQELSALRVLHNIEATQRDIFPDPTPEMRAGWARYPQRVHPLAWTHRSGRKSILLGSSADKVVDKAPEESRSLIDELNAWTTQPDFVYRHEWSVGDLVMWDNTGVLHKVDAYPADSGRMMHRTTLMGEEPIV